MLHPFTKLLLFLWIWSVPFAAVCIAAAGSPMGRETAEGYMDETEEGV